MAYDYNFKLVLIGDDGVGKTCLLHRFAEDKYDADYIFTIGVEFRNRTVQIDGKKIVLRFWDTAGREQFRKITHSFYRGADGIILVYDITQEKSYDNLIIWLRSIQEHANEGVERCILANKCDLTDKRMVSKEKGEGIAREHNIRFFETSAKESINVEEAILTFAGDILRRRRQYGTLELDRTGGCCCN